MVREWSGGIVCFTDFGMYVLSSVFVNFGITVTVITYGYVLTCLLVKFWRDDMCWCLRNGEDE